MREEKGGDERPSSLPLETVEAKGEEDDAGAAEAAEPPRGHGAVPEKIPEGAALWRKTGGEECQTGNTETPKRPTPLHQTVAEEQQMKHIVGQQNIMQ